MKLGIFRPQPLPEIEVIAEISCAYLHHSEVITGTIPLGHDVEEDMPYVITTEAVEPGYVTCGKYASLSGGISADRQIRRVKPLKNIEVFIELFGGMRSAVGYTIEWVGKTVGGVYELVEEGCPEARTIFYCREYEHYDPEGPIGLAELIRSASDAFCEAHPEVLRQWRLVDKDGNRVVLINYWDDATDIVRCPCEYVSEINGSGVSEEEERKINEREKREREEWEKMEKERGKMGESEELI